MFAAVMASTVPASLIMGRIGRRWGFSIGALAGIAGGAIAGYATLTASFYLLSLGTALVGVASAHATFFRFAAADTASPEYRSKAISLVLAGGVLAALVGPQLAKETRDLFGPESFAGAYFALAVLQLVVLATVQFIRIPRPRAGGGKAGRPLIMIALQPQFLVAVLCGLVGYGAMNLVMVATPLAMVDYHHSFGAAATVIQLHVLGMYLPSFFTGGLIARYGALRILTLGALLIGGCVVFNLTGVQFLQFAGSLVLLGVGWNFLFVGGSSLLTECYLPEERSKAQAINDFAIFGTVTATAFTSGYLYGQFGWEAVNLAVLVPLTLVLAAIAALAARRDPHPA
jgi:MFS family permease